VGKLRPFPGIAAGIIVVDNLIRMIIMPGIFGKGGGRGAAGDDLNNLVSIFPHESTIM
jgi:hypothetical protein